MLALIVVALWSFSLGKDRGSAWWLAAIVAGALLFSVIATGIRLQGVSNLHESAALVAPSLTVASALATAMSYVLLAGLAYGLGRLRAYMRDKRRSGQ